MANSPHLESTKTNIETKKYRETKISLWHKTTDKQHTENKKIQKNDVCTCIYRFFYVILQRKIKINLLWERY